MNSLPTDYQKYIHASRYARFRDDLGRRETWDETVGRYIDYFVEDLDERHGYKVSETLRSEISDGIHSLAIMPSMRALMTAGPALKRESISGYNCAYMPMDRVRSFGETLYILMCGTGLGFSVERQVISKLPEVPAVLNYSSAEILVGDSKEGWAAAYEEFVTALYAGTILRPNVSLVRPAGERLMTFGGRASGPEPLLELFEFTKMMFWNSRGRKLHSTELHEITSMIGKIVVVGGVRRSAEISLSNLSDLRMRNIKSGDWYDQKPWLGLANNSAVYAEKPESEIFMEEWLALYKSKSGERGIFNREGAQAKAAKYGRRQHDVEFGTNPCGEIILRPRGLCNLSEVVIRSSDGKGDILEKIRLGSILGTWQSTQTSFNFVEPEWKINAEEERLLGVSFTGIFDNEFMRGDLDRTELADYLGQAREACVSANKSQAEEIGINPSAATTTIKPSGTVSQLVSSPSGIHHGHSEFYMRRVNSDNKDPLTKFLIASGLPNEPNHMKPDSMTVFTFPIKLGSNTKTRDFDTAINHSEIVKLYSDHWSEHAVSCTVSVREHEWPSLGGWVYDNFNSIVGMSFLPHFEGDSVYKQKPYETIDEKTYEELVAAMPVIDWGDLGFYEAGEDHVNGTREFACVGGACDITDMQTM